MLYKKGTCYNLSELLGTTVLFLSLSLEKCAGAKGLMDQSLELELELEWDDIKSDDDDDKESELVSIIFLLLPK